jgi:pyridoxamine 5'-phosphate oxidase
MEWGKGMDELKAAMGHDPVAVFRAWIQEAEAKELNDANAVALASATRDGMPSVRIVLMKRLDERGFSFYTNAESQKGVELAENPRAAMCFHWKSLRRQVRASGSVTELPVEDVEQYFHTRSRLSQLGAVASAQSRLLEKRELLESRVRALEAEYPGEIPRPNYWKGYVLRPERIEFWQDGVGRLHDRFLFLRTENGWRVERLFP